MRVIACAIRCTAQVAQASKGRIVEQEVGGKDAGAAFECSESVAKKQNAASESVPSR